MSCRCCKPGEQEKKEKEGESQRTPFKNCRSDVCLLSRFSRVRLCDPTDCSPPGSPVHGILQEEYWSGFSRGPSWPRDQMSLVFCRWVLYH